MVNEIGGEFHLLEYPDDGLDQWPVRKSFFANARTALVALCRQWIETHSRSRLWLPDYFCSDVVSTLRLHNIPLVFYVDSPERSGPDFDHLRVSPNDMVMAVNYFGVRSGERWAEWRESWPAVALIEDHTHDPQSLWARNSTADFAFASLRKILPIPDGAIAWAPRGLPLVDAVQNRASIGSAVKLTAMLYKRRYLESRDARPDLKRTFLDLQSMGEQILAGASDEPMSAWSRSLVADGAPTRWRVRREENVRALLALAPGIDGGKPLFSTWPTGHCPFNAVYVFVDEQARERARNRLISAQIYAPVHWPLQDTSAAAMDLSRRILTIPLDFRCGGPELARIASVLADSALSTVSPSANAHLSV